MINYNTYPSTGLFQHWGNVWRALVFIGLLGLLVALGIVALALAVREWRRLMFKNRIWEQTTAEQMALQVELRRMQMIRQAQREGLIEQAPETPPAGGTSGQRPPPPAHDD